MARGNPEGWGSSTFRSESLGAWQPWRSPAVRERGSVVVSNVREPILTLSSTCAVSSRYSLFSPRAAGLVSRCWQLFQSSPATEEHTPETHRGKRYVLGVPRSI